VFSFTIQQMISQLSLQFHCSTINILAFTSKNQITVI